MAKKQVKVVQSEGKKEVPLDIVAQEVVRIGNAFKALQSGLISHKTLIVLIQANCKGSIGKEVIEEVLRVATNLPEICLKPDYKSEEDEAIVYSK